MGTILDVFETQAFTTLELTDAIRIVPIQYGRVGELDLFPARGVRARDIAVEYKNQVLNLLPTQPVGAPGTTAKIAKRDLRKFSIPHIPHDDTILAESLQGVRRFGTEMDLEGVFEVVNERLMDMRRKHDITLEFHRMGALKGKILDADGSTLLDLFAEFGISQKSVDFLLGTAGTEVAEKIREVLRHIEDNLLIAGETFNEVRALVDSSFFDKLVKHATIKDAYKFYTSTQEPLRQDVRRQFFHAGMFFEEYRGKATVQNDDGSVTTNVFLPTDEGIAFPRGTSQVMATYFAPANFIEAVNTRGLEVYAKQERMKFDKGIDLHTQSNPLPLVKRPQVLVKITTSD